MFFASNTLWKTMNGGQSWSKISPDLTRKTWEVPATVGAFRDRETAHPSQRGVIYTVAPSSIDINRIWAGTDDGLIHVTVDGGTTWKDVTPPDLKPWMKVSVMDAGRFDPLTAYAAINTLRLDDMRPHIYRTHDGGATWKHITAGLPDGAPVDAVREDPKRKGLLYAGTETQVHVSFDDGEHWESLRLNMPATSVRDVIVKGDDLIAGTHGRGIWILDDITPLRQIDSVERWSVATPRRPAAPADRAAAEPSVVLFKPQTAYRVRQNTNTDTPIPPDEAAGKNPPDGAIVNYALKADAAGPVTLEILDGAGNAVRHYSSEDPAESPDPATAPVPLYWYRPTQRLARTAGFHRFMWDVHYQSAVIPGGREGLPIAAVPYDTVPEPTAPWAQPGQYTVKLSVDGRSYTQPLTLKMDPRVKTPVIGLSQQFTLSKQVYDGLLDLQKALQDVHALKARATGALAERLSALEGQPVGGFGGRGASLQEPPTLNSVASGLSQLLNLLQEADVTPTTQLAAAVGSRRRELADVISRWNTVRQEAATQGIR
jgi:hypothetical protein